MRVFLAKTHSNEYVITTDSLAEARDLLIDHFKSKRRPIPAFCVSELPMRPDGIIALRDGMAKYRR